MACALGNVKSVRMFAPASVGNVAVGFDVVGHAISGVGDVVVLEQVDEPGVEVVSITGVLTDLPMDAERNTAAAAVKAMADDLGFDKGFRLSIEKGIPLGSGMGGSAASAAAAVAALNQMLKIPMSLAECYPYALAGEAAASGGRHGDNVGPSLVGGLTISGPASNPQVISVPVPNQLRCVIVRPNHIIETRQSRGALPESFERSVCVDQMANLAAFIAGCYERDLDRIEASLADVLIEPWRAGSIPGFADVKQAALDAEAMGCSISGSGPSVFAWFRSESQARIGRDAMVNAFADHKLETEAFTTPVNAPGARPA